MLQEPWGGQDVPPGEGPTPSAEQPAGVPGATILAAAQDTG